MSLIESLKTSVYYDDIRFNHLKVAVVKYLVNNGTTNGEKLLKDINQLRESDLDVMVKYRIINKKFMAMDNIYSISDWARKLIVPNTELPILTIVNTNLDSIEIITETETETETETSSGNHQESYCKIT